METYLFRPTRPLVPEANRNELPKAPLCVSTLMPPRGYEPMSKLVLKPLTVSMTPTQFGPISRIEAERRISIRSFCRCLASGASISPKPADMQMAPLTSLKRRLRSTSSLATGTVNSAATMRTHMSTGSGMSLTLL